MTSLGPSVDFDVDEQQQRINSLVVYKTLLSNTDVVTLALWRSFLFSLLSSKVSWKSRLVEASEMVRLTPPT